MYFWATIATTWRKKSFNVVGVIWVLKQCIWTILTLRITATKIPFRLLLLRSCKKCHLGNKYKKQGLILGTNLTVIWLGGIHNYSGYGSLHKNRKYFNFKNTLYPGYFWLWEHIQHYYQCTLRAFKHKWQV